MAEYLSPGVYMEEVNSGPRPIEGAGTATAAFVGFAPDGPINEPTLVTNWSQYVDKFGLEEKGSRKKNPHMAGAYLSHAVYGYFLNGHAPKQLKAGGTVQLPTRASKAIASMVLQAKTDDGGPIEIEVAAPTG